VNRARRLWDRLWGLDPRLLDGALAVVLAVGADLQLLSQEPGDFARLVPVTFTCLPLILRRRYPIVGHFLQIAAFVATQRQPVSISQLAILISIYSVSVYSRWRRVFLIWMAIGAAWIGILFPDSRLSVPSWALLLVGGFSVFLTGNAVRNRQMRADVLEERALRLEHERELSMQLARADERRAIARELHDVVAHSVSVMVIQAGAARTLLGRDPERSAEALRAVESNGREALGELRRMLGLLTGGDTEPALAPQPGLEQLDRLIERVGQAGLAVDLHVEGTPRPLSPGLDLAAYRIIQEALTNALKHASGAKIQIRVAYSPEDELRLEVVDSGGAPLDGANGAGRGLLGMRERVAMYGGDLEAGPRPEGGFAVRARLPLEAA
jgi:signal transduction histidine kinase